MFLLHLRRNITTTSEEIFGSAGEGSPLPQPRPSKTKQTLSSASIFVFKSVIIKKTPAGGGRGIERIR